MRRGFLKLQRQLDATAMLATHDPGEATLLADEFLLPDCGRVLQQSYEFKWWPAIHNPPGEGWRKGWDSTNLH